MSQLTVWYDAGCSLCTREIAFMRRLDRAGAIRFVDSTGDDASCPIDRAELLGRFHASEDSVLVSGAAAFAAMWRMIPLLRPLGLAARQPWVLALLEHLYVRFLRVRDQLQLVRRSSWFEDLASFKIRASGMTALASSWFSTVVPPAG